MLRGARGGANEYLPDSLREGMIAS
jgi:hypothetical protein